jgi:hypothetical protein
MSDKTSSEQVTERVEAEFRLLETSLAASNPGVLDILQVYGGYDAALKQADAYLGTLEPILTFFPTTDGTGS